MDIKMARKSILLLIILILIAASLSAQTTYFGKNKVQYKQLTWEYIQSRHFDIYFNSQKYQTAKFAASVLESAYVEISEQLNYRIRRRIPVFIYNSPNDFQQTNIIPSLLPEGVGGFTEAFKNRIVIPFDGSEEDFRHVLHHELTHAFTYDMLYGNSLSSLISRQRLFQIPLWLAEGYAEYSSRHGWDYSADMTVRDATINNYLTPPDYLSGYLAYKEGQALVKYIVDTYGPHKIGELFSKGKVTLSMTKASKGALGITPEEMWNGFSKEMKRRYWPEIAKRKEASEIGKALTNHEKDASHFNANPVFSPKGDRLAMFSDRSDYMEIYLISAVDGKVIDRLVKAERSGDLESLHSYWSGITFSPDGENIAFVAKSDGWDALYFSTVKDKDIYLKKHFKFNSILSPVWSPDGKKIAFAAIDGRMRDIIVYDIDGDSTYNLNHDIQDDIDPSWYPDSKHIAFSSDRPHPDNEFFLKDPYYKPKEGQIDYRTLYYLTPYGNYNLFTVDIETKKITPIHCGPGQNRQPVVSSDGKQICFVSNRNGIDNLYTMPVDGNKATAITDVLTGISSPTWSPDGKQIAFSSFNKGGFDVFIMKDWSPAGDNGVLEPTDFALGKYGDPEEMEALFEPKMAKAAEEETDSIKTDSTQAESPLAVHQKEAETKDTLTAAADTTRIENGEYVYVSEKKETSKDALDSLFTNVSSDSTKGGRFRTKEEQAAFDSVSSNNRLPNGEYKVHDYRVKFTPDYVNGGFSYDTFFGLQGQSVFVFSDYLGDHQIYLLTDLVNTIDQTNFQLYYFYNRMRVDLGIGIFHSKNYYIDSNDFLFSDRFYGAQAYASLPFSMFSRLQLGVSQFFIDRSYRDYNDPRPDRSTRVTMATLSHVKDNILWGVTGPLNGQRSRIDLTGAMNLFSPDSMSFYSMEVDYRKYWHIRGLFSFAFRVSGGGSGGKTPKRYFLGGISNKIGSSKVPADVYDVDNLYFSDVVTPMRGYDYYAMSGTRYALLNLEFRYPFVEYLKMNFPLPLTIGYITGNIFYDMGAAWDNDRQFKGGISTDGPARLNDIKSAFGFGIRANLGIFVLRYDLAWATNFAYVADHPKHYFSIGADF
jgi:Tol biopolymer transport system component